jgi:hypothetical protein
MTNYPDPRIIDHPVEVETYRDPLFPPVWQVVFWTIVTFAVVWLHGAVA